MKDTSSNTSSIINGKDDTLYSQKGERVLIDRTKKDTKNSLQKFAAIATDAS